MQIIYLDGAEDDALEIWTYLSEHSPPRALAFHKATVRCEVQLAQYPESGRVYFQKFRRLIVPRFKYALIYRVYATRIVISAVVSLYLPREMLLRRLKR